MRPTTVGFIAPLLRPLAASCALTLACLVPLGAPAATNELGHPVVRDFPPGKSGFSHLCEAVAQDRDGFIYIANNTTARCYDGATWRRFDLPTQSAGIRKFAVTAKGTVYAAGASVIGYFEGAGETARYVSLAGHLPITAGGYEDLFDVLAVGEAVYFSDEEKILIWKDGAFTVVACRSPAHSRGAHLHRIGPTVYVSAPNRPLCRLVGDRLESVADDPVFREDSIIAIEPGAGDSLVVLTASRGFFQLSSGRLARMPVEANRWLTGRTVLCAQRLGDGSFVVAFTSVSGNGGMHFDPSFRYVGAIDQSIGLYVNTVRNFFCDRDGGLWLASETGMFRLDLPSTLTVFDAVNGLGQGSVVDVIRHDGTLFAATTEGVYRLTPSNDDDGRCARFERVFNHPAYSLVSHPDGLLVAGYADLYVLSQGSFISVAKLPPGGGILRLAKDGPDRLWLDASAGLYSLRRTSGGWREEGPVGDKASLSRDNPGTLDSALASLPALVRDSAGGIARTREEAAGSGRVLWICGTKGLVRVDRTTGFPKPVPFAAILTPEGVHDGDRIPAGEAGIKFRYVALRHQLADSVVYQTRLLGRDRDWSAWSDKREQAYDDLPAGDYRFEVRARDADGQLASPAALAFAVLPLWWLTAWAIAAYVLVGTGLLAALVRLRTRALRLNAGRLERIVADRTLELARKNTELVRLNRLESEEKIAARLAEEKARLEVLRYQLNPHFLYNTLASISASLPTGAGRARAMVERLAEFCRLTLHRSPEEEGTSLGEEIRLLRTYLEIERSRWGELLDVEIDFDPALAEERLPHFLLLPLVENALKYGRATSPDRVGLKLFGRREASGSVVIEVANTGQWVEPSDSKSVSSLGIGLENLRQRLARYYPRSHELALAHADGWVTVTLRLYSLQREAGKAGLVSPPSVVV